MQTYYSFMQYLSNAMPYILFICEACKPSTSHIGVTLKEPPAYASYPMSLCLLCERGIGDAYERRYPGHGDEIVELAEHFRSIIAKIVHPIHEDETEMTRRLL